MIILTEAEIFTLQGAVENLRGGATDPDARFRIASKIEAMLKRPRVKGGSNSQVLAMLTAELAFKSCEKGHNWEATRTEILRLIAGA